MDNDSIKKALLQIHECKTDFTVTMTGKASKKINGLYKPATHEILLHNRNFKNDNQIMYTAIHELTHHVLHTEMQEDRQKSHSGPFWSTFAGFLDRAVELNLYSRKRSEETQKLVQEAAELHKQITELQISLGKLLNKLSVVSFEAGERFEDIVNRDLQLDSKTVTTLRNMAAGNNKIPFEIQKLLQNSSKAQAPQIIAAVQAGKTVSQIRAAAKNTGTEHSEYSDLVKERDRLEHTITQLKTRYEEIMEQLQEFQEQKPGYCAAETTLDTVS
jgi:hypothetical protein